MILESFILRYVLFIPGRVAGLSPLQLFLFDIYSSFLDPRAVGYLCKVVLTEVLGKENQLNKSIFEV
jgi:hypothetical protein